MTSTLFDYMEQVQRFCRDTKQDMLDPGNIISYINRARREIAMRTQCLRVLTPISGAVVTASVIAGGTGYSNNPTITITAPDFPSGTGANPSGAQATASALVQSGAIAAVDINYGGSGYFQPQAAVTDATGTGASVTLQISQINQLNPNQEVYPFSGVDLAPFPGVDSVYMVKSISIIYANYRYSLPCYAFSVYQALIRTYPYQYTYVPSMCSQYGQGVGGSFYVYPLPSQVYQYELDCLCIPQDLTDNQSVEALPLPWTEAVPYFAAHFAYLELQNFNAGQYYFDLFDKMVQRYSNYARPGRTTNPYGRY